jgi:hypothetical protein
MNAPSRLSRLTPKEWALVALGVGTWVAIAAAGVWLVHQMTRSTSACGTQLEARTTQAHPTPAAGPRNSLQLLTGTGRCK